MPQVTEQTARKDYPSAGIKKGERYFKWKFRFGPVHRSKTRPLPSQLTQSEYLSQAYRFEESVDDLDTSDPEAVVIALQDMAEEIRSLGEEQLDRLYNMPDGLQEGEVGQLLQTRSDACGEVADAIETAADTITEAMDNDGAAPFEAVEDALQSISWGWE